MLIAPKFHKYQDANRKIILLSDIADIQPYEITLPEPPPPEQIINFGLKPEEQYFQRTPIPAELINMDKACKKPGKSGVDLLYEAHQALDSNTELSDYVESLWRIREHGQWQYIHGIPYYFTGDYWFYTNHFSLGKTLPDFRITSLQKFQWWQFCVRENENAYGGIEFTRRQVGKSREACGIFFNQVTSHDYCTIGTQSSTEEIAKSLFFNGFGLPFKSLMFFFKPIYDSTAGTKRQIHLTHDQYPCLESKVDFRSSDAGAYDNATLDGGIVDECGKFTKPADPIELLERLKPALERNGKIAGKYLFTTTVEEIEGGGVKSFNEIWKGSSLRPQDKMIDELGRTRSGLVPYFVPATHNIFFDQYGMSIIDSPKKYQSDWRKAQGHPHWNMGGREFIDKLINGQKNQQKKQAMIRKYPRNIKEALHSITKVCHFDLDIINDRLDDFYMYPTVMPDDLKGKLAFGKLDWQNGVFGSKVIFRGVEDTEDADYIFSFLPPENMRNKQVMENGKPSPGNTAYFSVGVDSFKFDTEDVKNKEDMSDGAIAGYAVFNPNIDTPDKMEAEHVTDDFFVIFKKRPPTVDEFCEEVLKLVIFLGCKAFPENNNPDVIKYFKLHNFERYLQFEYKLKITSEGAFWTTSGTSGGANTNTRMIGTIFRLFQAYVVSHPGSDSSNKGAGRPGRRMKFMWLMKDLKEVTPDNLNPFDVFVACGYALAAIFDKPQIKKDEAVENIEDILEVYGYNRN